MSPPRTTGLLPLVRAGHPFGGLLIHPRFLRGFAPLAGKVVAVLDDVVGEWVVAVVAGVHTYPVHGERIWIWEMT